MKVFKVHKLPQLTKSTYESQQRWIDKNWQDTLKKHYRETEVLLNKIGIFDVWKNMLSSKYGQVVNELMPEIFMDAYISLHFACMGLYKQAYVSLRAQQETVLRLVYFSTHPVEFNWWHSGSGWYRDFLRTRDVWGEGYVYFEQLDQVKNFERVCKFKLFNIVKSKYKGLSIYVHSGVGSFQTTPARFSPKYKLGDFKKWVSSFKEVQSYINIILILGFALEFKGVRVNIQRKILKAIDKIKYKQGLRKSLGLKIKGRI
ncbi:hypothetical protein ES705_17011 [subsurface metagenome]